MSFSLKSQFRLVYASNRGMEYQSGYNFLHSFYRGNLFQKWQNAFYNSMLPFDAVLNVFEPRHFNTDLSQHRILIRIERRTET